MTTLIAFQHDDFCLIAADTQTTAYHLSSDCSPMGKIAQNGKYVIGAAGLVRGMNLIQHAFNPPVAPKTKVDKFMVTRFLPALRRCFIASGYEMKDDGEVATHDNEFIVAVNGTIYQIDEAYGLEIIADRLYVSGTGMDLALGAAYALDIQKAETKEEATAILIKAVKASIKFDIYSGGTVQVAYQDKKGKTEILFN